MAGSPVVLRIKLRYDDVDTMVQKFAPNVGKSGLFVPTKSMQPVGTEVKFELRLFNDTPVLVGLGRVKYTRPPDPANPKAPYGIAIELMRVSREGRELIIRMLERRKAMGLPEVAIPQPEDERREDSTPRADTSGIVRDAMAQFASAPVADQMLTATMRSEPVAVAVPLDPVSRPITASVPPPIAPVTPLAPEPVRARRPAVAELIAKASESGPVEAAVEGFDDAKIDLAKVLARARALAAMSGGDELDAELAKLQEVSGTPEEISIEAASAELAKQLGGVAVVHKDRSASTAWAPPPAVVVARPEPKPQAVTVDEPEAEAEAVAAAEPEAVAEPEYRSSSEILAPEALATVPNADDAQELDSQDLEDEELDDDAAYGEHTQIGASPIDPELADRLDAHLAQAEADADAEFSGFSQPPGQFVDGEYIAQPQADSDGVPQDEEIEEIDDLDVLAEADAEDADLLSADGERDSHDGAPAYRDPPQPYQDSEFTERPSQQDFASRLDLDEPDPNEFEERHDHYRHTPSARPGTYDPPSGGYTVAEPSYGDQGLDFDEPHAYGQRLPSHHAAVAPQRDSDLESALEQLDMDLPDVRAVAAREGSRPVALPGLPVHRGDTGEINKPTVLGVQAEHKQPAKPRLPTEDDGILIDFDDDE